MAGRATLCLITDRRRLAGRVGASLDRASSLVARQIEGAVAAGVELVQLRERDLSARDLVALARLLATITHGTTTRLLVNDRIDVALVAAAGGSHLRADSPPPPTIRALVPSGWVVSCAVHSEAAVQRARGADVLVAGTLFSTPSKPHDGTLLGLDGLTRVVQAAGAVPVLAVGGITAATAAGIKRAGAAGVAAIGAFLPEPAGDLAGSVQQQAILLRLAFDSADRAP
ncbi:MAG: thiamine phosphate synthase [Acidobacteria bacterium]|nr:thiamine phosphate synthase [Acidobacteriota bacterium]